MRFKGIELTKRDADRFWAKVDQRGPDDCWPWIAGLTAKGYGKFGIDRAGVRKTCVASQVALALSGVEITGWVLHHCDNPPCCNPRHLYVGTPKQNLDDHVQRNGQHMRSSGDHCRLGHPRTEENTRLYEWRGKTYKRCRDCENERSIARWAAGYRPPSRYPR